MTKTGSCPRCHQERDTAHGYCSYCRAVTQAVCSGSRVQSVGEGEQWQDHVDEYKREREELSGDR